jgi:hypothetical protein
VPSFIRTRIRPSPLRITGPRGKVGGDVPPRAGKAGMRGLERGEGGGGERPYCGRQQPLGDRLAGQIRPVQVLKGNQ